LVSAEKKPGVPELGVGDRVQAQFDGGESWYPGVVSAVNEDGTYHVEYDDGDVESAVAGDLIRAEQAGGGLSTPSPGEEPLTPPPLPPPPPPRLGTEKRFGAFLSHFKDECGSEARLVCEKLAAMRPDREFFLDSGEPIEPHSRTPWQLRCVRGLVFCKPVLLSLCVLMLGQTTCATSTTCSTTCASPSA
jgi:hypothetical protein